MSIDTLQTDLQTSLEQLQLVFNAFGSFHYFLPDYFDKYLGGITKDEDKPVNERKIHGFFYVQDWKIENQTIVLQCYVFMGIAHDFNTEASNDHYKSIKIRLMATSHSLIQQLDCNQLEISNLSRFVAGASFNSDNYAGCDFTFDLTV